jgi:hypothetical protein
MLRFAIRNVRKLDLMIMSISEDFPLRVPFQILLIMVIQVMPLWGVCNFNANRPMGMGSNPPRKVSGPNNFLMGVCGLWTSGLETTTLLAGVGVVEDNRLPQEIAVCMRVQHRHLIVGNT